MVSWLSVGGTASTATLEGIWLDQMGSVEVGGMRFNGADSIADTIRAAGAQCDGLVRLETQPGSLLVTCDPEDRQYRLLPDAEGNPLVAPLN